MSDFLEILLGALLFLGGIVAAGFILIGGPYLLWGDRNVEDIKAHAAATWKQQGFQIIGYEGYTLGLFETPGGCVWHTLRRAEEPQTVYTGCVSKWGNEYHTYNTHALNAVRPH
jgi:hypothetical protein